MQPLQLADTLIGIEEVNLQEVEVSGEGFGLGRCKRFFGLRRCIKFFGLERCIRFFIVWQDV